MTKLTERIGFAICALSLIRPSTFDIRHYYSVMLDIRLIREKPDFVRERLATRGGGDEAKIDEVLNVDAERRRGETELQKLRAEQNKLSKEIGARRARREDATVLIRRANPLADEIDRLADKLGVLQSENLERQVLLQIPN